MQNILDLNQKYFYLIRKQKQDAAFTCELNTNSKIKE